MSKSKQPQPKGKKREDFNSLVPSPHVDPFIKQLKTNLEYFKKILFQWSNLTSGNNYLERRDKELLKKYLYYKNEYFESDQYGAHSELLDNLNVNLERVVDESIIFKSFELFKKAKWPIRFNSKFIARINDYNINEIYYILGYVYFLAEGNIVSKGALKSPWGYSRPLDTKLCDFNKFYVLKLYTEKNLFYQVGVEKVPVIKNGIIKRFEYRSYMQFLDLLGDQFVENRNKLNERMTIFVAGVMDDVAKKDHSEEIEINNWKNMHLENFLFHHIVNDYTGRTEYYCRPLSDTEHKVYLPLEFKTYYVSDFENSSMIFDDKIKRWVTKEHFNFMERKKIAEYQKQISDSMIKRFVDFQSAKTLVELLTKIPNFKVNLTEQEKDVIGENGNVLAIGRSGTGKTTCAVLRLFSIEMLFKIRLSLFQKKFQDTVKDVRCGSSDIDQTFGLHCIFLTASPVLTHEIQRYYKKLTDNIKQQLEHKKKKLEAEKKKKQEERKLRQAEEEKEIQQEEIKQREEEVNDSVQVLKVPEEEKKEAQDIVIPQSLTKTESQKSAEAIEEEEEMNQQFKDIELREDINHQQFEGQEQEDIDELKHKFEENIKKYHTLYDLKQSDYPGFFTVKSYIMLIDGILRKPFFIRSKSTVIEQDARSAWHNERKGVMMIENYYRSEGEEKEQYNIEAIEEEINYSDEEELEHEYLRQIQLRENKDKQQLTKKLESNKYNKNRLSFEVDYDYFIVHFWPRVVKKYYSSRNITPHLVWTEIYSTIKGSAEAHQYPGQYLTQSAYLSLSSNTFLSKEEKLDIYETFCQYERWKIKSGGYDIMDAVNYILNFLRFKGYDGPEIHYIMIDEVQDLPHAMVYLLSKTATYGVFYSGDTAQTIAKGVGFRFCDLKSLFNKTSNAFLALKTPVIKHLTVNFRSHNNILQLANSIVSSLQILFPKTIDRLKKQISDLSGPKPMILSQSDEQLLFYVLSGDEQKKTEPGIKKPLQFGCDQVIIVRDQESKAKIPAMLQHALCLTVYEAKGLQFNDVILFNFFTETPCPQKWSILKNLNVITTEVPKEEYESHLSHRKQPQRQPTQKKEEEEEERAEEMESFNPLTNSYSVKKIVNNVSKTFNKDINDYAELCSELKLLYTAITRPRKTLIIYDSQETTARNTIQKLWDRLDVIEVVTKQMVLEADNKKTAQSEEVKVFKKIIATTDKASWKQQGLKMYARGYFDQAMKCFERSANLELYKKAEANKFADDATKKLIEIESERNAIKQNAHTYENMRSSDLSKLKKELKHEQARSLKKFQHAAVVFEDLLMWKQAGQCYFSGKFFEKAFACFCKAFMNKQAAESLEMQNKYREAAQFYQKDGNYLKVIECLDLVNEWVAILEKINLFSDKMSEYQKQALLKKYSALALQELVYQIEFENEQQNLKPENNRVEVIAEGQSDEEEEEDSEQDPELAAEREYQRKLSAELSNKEASRKQSEVSQQPKIIQIADSIYQKPEIEVEAVPIEALVQQKADVSASFSDLNESSSIQPQAIDLKQQIKPQIAVAKDVSMSFEDLNQSSEKQFVVQTNLAKKEQSIDLVSIESSFQDINSKYENELQPDLESIKSMVDPDDLWIRNSISQITNKLQSEYSVIDDTEQNYNLNVKIIKTKGNIFVQDEIMRKIVNIVSIINNSILEFFKQFKGYQSLITVSNKEGKEQAELDQRPEISEFEDIDPKFINIILDTLESFKLFKLCLFVCNRYHMPSKAGRYLISLGMKYSTNCISNNVVNPILLAPSAYRKIQIQKGILASIALHSIYENVNAEFLKVKVTEKSEDSNKSLGNYFIQGLILQGVYKKAVFMVDPQQSLKILANYNDFQAYNNIYRQKIAKNEENIHSLNFLPAAPSNRDDIQFSLMLLKKAVFDYCVVYKFQTIGLRYYKQFESNPQLPIDAKLKQYQIPAYIPYASILFGDRAAIGTNLKSLIAGGYSILQKGDNLQVFDLVSLLLIIVHNEELQSQLVQQFSMDEFLQFYRCINYIRQVLRKMTGHNVINIVDSVLNVHQCHRIRYCKSMTFINDLFCFVHRSSTVANELVENAKVNAHQFAYFFEQDYNLILSKTSRIVKIISKKYQNSLIKLYRQRIAFTKYGLPILFEDFVCREEEIVLKKALTIEIDLIIDPKKKKKADKVDRKKSKDLKPSIDYKMHNNNNNQIMINEDYSVSEESEQGEQEFKHYRPSTNPKMKYLASLMLHGFLDSSKRAKEILDGRDLYGCGMNSYYRQYTAKMGGFNLFDAVQFKRFRRVDLFAENILSIFDSLTLYAKHNYLAEILVLLLVQYRSIDEPKGFSLAVTTKQLKYLQNLSFVAVNQGAANEHKLHNEQVRYLLVNNTECKFNYKNEYVCEMNRTELAGMICDYLQILRDEQYSQFVNLPNIVLVYVLNIQKDNEINQSLRKIINSCAKLWKLESLYPLMDCKSGNEYAKRRAAFMATQYRVITQKIHTICVENVGNLDKAIEQSEFDYEVEGKLIQGRRKAARKIALWWRAKRQALKASNSLKHNYLQLAVQPSLIQTVKKPDNYILGDIRLMTSLHKNSDIYSELNLLIQTEKAREDLLSFYLVTTIASSLDFHFILMTLNKIEDCRRKYLNYSRTDIEYLDSEDISDIREEMSEMLQTIGIWKNDEKWLREKNINLKRKKVFEVKWMTKNQAFSNILKKRAGLKKQEKLQQKARFIKRLK